MLKNTLVGLEGRIEPSVLASADENASNPREGGMGGRCPPSSSPHALAVGAAAVPAGALRPRGLPAAPQSRTKRDYPADTCSASPTRVRGHGPPPDCAAVAPGPRALTPPRATETTRAPCASSSLPLSPPLPHNPALRVDSNPHFSASLRLASTLSLLPILILPLLTFPAPGYLSCSAS